MINLLPADLKNGYLYGRRNVALRRWILMFLAAFVGLGIISTYGLLSLHQSTRDFNSQISATQDTFKKEDFAGTQAHVQDISNSFRLVVKVLSQEVLFSQLIKQIGAAMPNNTNLTGLNINQIQGGLNITADATDYNSASQVQLNLADPANKIFNKADIVSITCGASTAANPKYPCNVVIRALFAANNPFLFINSKVTP